MFETIGESLMQYLNKTVLLIAIIGLAPLAMAAGDPAEERHERMENVVEEFKSLGGMAKGELDFDSLTAMGNLAAMKQQITGIEALFPEGSYVEGEKRAAKAVWENRADFDQKMADFGMAIDSAIEANPQSQAELQPLVQNLVDSCKGCHEDYRTPGN
jgi:cytochrome c556